MNRNIDFVLFGDRNDNLAKALELFGKTRTDLDEYIRIVKEWLTTQKHFPETTSKFFTFESACTLNY